MNAQSFGILAITCFAVAAPASAQTTGCTMTDSTSGPARQILVCSGGPKIEAEAKAVVRVIDKASDGTPQGAQIDSGAAIFDVPHQYKGGFQITAPRAVASVRGTQWIVDVQPDLTAVFVMRGEVAVHRPESTQTVVLKKGDGVEVDGGTEPLTPAFWPKEKAAALLARFGR